MATCSNGCLREVDPADAVTMPRAIGADGMIIYESHHRGGCQPKVYLEFGGVTATVASAFSSTIKAAEAVQRRQVYERAVAPALERR